MNSPKCIIILQHKPLPDSVSGFFWQNLVEAVYRLVPKVNSALDVETSTNFRRISRSNIDLPLLFLETVHVKCVSLKFVDLCSSVMLDNALPWNDTKSDCRSLLNTNSNSQAFNNS